MLSSMSYGEPPQIGFVRPNFFMATQKQIEANRRNAQFSTGPRTEQGKEAVRMNALRHGMRARTVVLPGEDRQEFFRLCDTLQAEWQPLTSSELFYLEQMAISQWKLTRMEVGEADVYHEVTSAKTQVPLLDRLWKAQCRLERSYARAQRELERIQTHRANQAPQLDAVSEHAIPETPEVTPEIPVNAPIFNEQFILTEDPIPGLEWEEVDKCHMLESVWDRGGMRKSAGT